MKIQQQDEDTKMKLRYYNKMKNKKLQPTSQKPPRSQAKCHCWEFFTFDLKKNDCSSVIGITFIFNIVFHMLAILVFNKDNC